MDSWYFVCDLAATENPLQLDNARSSARASIMADIVDLAQVNEERLVKYAPKRSEGPQAVGYCLSCGPEAPLELPLRWCDADCRDDWEKGVKYGR